MSGPSFSVLKDAAEVIDYIINYGDEGGTFLDMTRDQLAKELGWVDKRGNPERRRVEDALTATRTQHIYPEAAGLLGGYTVSYAPNRGGIAMFDPDGARTTRRMLNAVKGDIQRDQYARTVNERRQPTWHLLGTQFANEGDHELARICWQAEYEIKTTGFVAPSTTGDLFKCLRTRGLMEEAS